MTEYPTNNDCSGGKGEGMDKERHVFRHWFLLFFTFLFILVVLKTLYAFNSLSFTVFNLLSLVGVMDSLRLLGGESAFSMFGGASDVFSKLGASNLVEVHLSLKYLNFATVSSFLILICAMMFSAKFERFCRRFYAFIDETSADDKLEVCRTIGFLLCGAFGILLMFAVNSLNSTQFEILSKRATGNCEISEQAGRTYGLYLNGQISKSEFDLRLADHFIESDRLLYCEEFKGSGFSNADKGLREDLAANMNVFRTEEGKAKRLRLTCPFEFYGNRSSGE